MNNLHTACNFNVTNWPCYFFFTFLFCFFLKQENLEKFFFFFYPFIFLLAMHQFHSFFFHFFTIYVPEVVIISGQYFSFLKPYWIEKQKNWKTPWQHWRKPLKEVRLSLLFCTADAHDGINFIIIFGSDLSPPICNVCPKYHSKQQKCLFEQDRRFLNISAIKTSNSAAIQ